jgi:dephospho-CoA kinase
MRIIGITGTLGAGKGTVVEYLVKEHGFRHFSVRSFLTSVIQQRGLTLNRDTMVHVANELRSRHSPAYIVEALYRDAQSSGNDCVIESIRTPGEIDALEAKGSFQLLAVDANPELRYGRVIERKSATDRVTYETFLANELREMESSDPNAQNLSECIRRASIHLENNGSFEELYKQVEFLLNQNSAPAQADLNISSQVI